MRVKSAAPAFLFHFIAPPNKGVRCGHGAARGLRLPGTDRFTRTHTLVVTALVAVYCAYFSAMSVLSHAIYATQAYDLGTFDQGIWLAGHSDSLFVTVRGLHLLGDHVRVVSLLLAPIYWIWDDVRFLLILHACTIGLGGTFVYLIGRCELPSHPWAVLGICLSYLLNPAVHNLTTDYAHPDGFATTLILASIYFLRSNKIAAFWVTVALAMTCKEDIPLVYTVMGLWLMGTGRAQLGGFLAAAAVVYFAVALLVILPHFNAAGFYRLNSAGFGHAFMNKANPLWAATHAVDPVLLRYLLLLGAPLAFLFLFSPWVLLPALPALVANIFSDMHYTRSILYHYTSSIEPFLYLATILTLGKMSESEPLIDIDLVRARIRKLPLRVSPTALAWGLIVPLTLALSYTHGRYGVGAVDKLFIYHNRAITSPQIAAIQRAVAQIPADAAVSTHFTFVPHLSHRKLIYMWPNPFKPIGWGVKRENPDPTDIVDYILMRGKVDAEREDWKTIAELVERGQFRRIAGDDAVHLYESLVAQPQRDAAREKIRGR